MLRRTLPALALGSLAALCLLGISSARPLSSARSPLPPTLSAGWGVDGCISCHAQPSEWGAYIAQAQKARLRYIRERNPGDLSDPANWEAGRLAAFRKLRAAGLDVVAFVQLAGLPPRHEWSSLPEDLRAVYWSAYHLSAQMGDLVSAWEMSGEPDAFFCKDSPEQLVALQKAVYLGLKDGGSLEDARWKMENGKSDRSQSPIAHRPSPARPSVPPPAVLMGALAYAPGPWLERAARNGLYDYTDGVNFHFYGHARDFRGVVLAQRNFAARFTPDRALPLWVTECGLDATPEGDPDNAHGRELQRAFTLQTAAVARQTGVAVFMPFILVTTRPGGHALLKSATGPYPAWSAFAQFTRRFSLPAGPASAPPRAPNRIVLQWRPDFETCIPHKVSGGYWFLDDEDDAPPEAIAGEVVVYNFSAKPVTGALAFTMPSDVRLEGAAPLENAQAVLSVPAFGMVRVPVRLKAESVKFIRSEVKIGFRPDGEDTMSRLEFTVGLRPSDERLRRVFPVKGDRPGTHGFDWIWAPEPYRVSGRGGPWLGVNGVDPTLLDPGSPAPREDGLERAWAFRVEGKQTDPRFPPMAVTMVDGLPDLPDGFLRVRVPDTVESPFMVRVDLIDKRGQRFTVAEGYGDNPYEPEPWERFLAFKDFHLYQWGRCTDDPVFRPEDVREIQLRLSLQPGKDKTAIQLDVVAL